MITMNLPRRHVEVYPFSNIRRTWLISIADVGMEKANVTPNKFERILFVHFNDDEPDSCDKPETLLSDETVKEMVEFIAAAKAEKVDLIVNCHAGICRSGAVVEVLKLAGWSIDDNEWTPERLPNRFVFDKLRKALGFKHSWE